MQLASAVAVVGGGLRHHLQIDHLVQHGVPVVPVVRVALGGQPLIGGPLLEHKGAVGDDIARFDPLLTIFLDGGFGGREGGVVRQRLQEEGNRFFQGHLQGMFIQRLDPQCIGALLALNHFAGIGDTHQFDKPGVVGGGLGIGRPLPAVDIVGGSDWLAIRPFGLRPQLEGVDGAGAVELIAERACGLGFTLGIQHIETFEQIVDDGTTCGLFHQLRIYGGGLGADIGDKGLLGIRQQPGACRHFGSPDGQGEQSGYRAGNDSLVH